MAVCTLVHAVWSLKGGQVYKNIQPSSWNLLKLTNFELAWCFVTIFCINFDGIYSTVRGTPPTKDDKIFCKYTLYLQNMQFKLSSVNLGLVKAIKICPSVELGLTLGRCIDESSTKQSGAGLLI